MILYRYNGTGAKAARRRVGQITSGARAGSIVAAIHAHAARLKLPGQESRFANVGLVAPALPVPLEQEPVFIVG